MIWQISISLSIALMAIAIILIGKYLAWTRKLICDILVLNVELQHRLNKVDAEVSCIANRFLITKTETDFPFANCHHDRMHKSVSTRKD